MSNTLYTSDLHIGHARVAEIRGFASVEAHDAWMTAMWKTHVGQRDTVYVLGDIAVDKVDYALALIDGLPGEKHLIAGNHDLVHPLHYRKFNSAFEKHAKVFRTIAPFRQRKVNGFPIMLSHFPYESWGDGPARAGARFEEWRLPDRGRPLLHGHTHGTEREHGNMMHVGIDAWGRPVKEAWVAEWLNDFHGGKAARTWAEPWGWPWGTPEAKIVEPASLAVDEHAFDQKFPIVCHKCKNFRTSLAKTVIREKKMLCLRCSLGT